MRTDATVSLTETLQEISMTLGVLVYCVNTFAQRRSQAPPPPFSLLAGSSLIFTHIDFIRTTITFIDNDIHIFWHRTHYDSDNIKHHQNKFCSAQQTSPYAPLQVLSHGNLNNIFSVYSESFMTTVVTMFRNLAKKQTSTNRFFILQHTCAHN